MKTVNFKRISTGQFKCHFDSGWQDLSKPIAREEDVFLKKIATALIERIQNDSSNDEFYITGYEYYIKRIIECNSGYVVLYADNLGKIYETEIKSLPYISKDDVVSVQENRDEDAVHNAFGGSYRFNEIKAELINKFKVKYPEISKPQVTEVVNEKKVELSIKVNEKELDGFKNATDMLSIKKPDQPIKSSPSPYTPQNAIAAFASLKNMFDFMDNLKNGYTHLKAAYEEKIALVKKMFEREKSEDFKIYALRQLGPLALEERCQQLEDKIRALEAVEKKIQEQVTNIVDPQWQEYHAYERSLNVVKKSVIWAIYSAALDYLGLLQNETAGNTVKRKARFEEWSKSFDAVIKINEKTGEVSSIESAYEKFSKLTLKEFALQINQLLKACDTDFFAFTTARKVDLINIQLKQLIVNSYQEAPYKIQGTTFTIDPSLYDIEKNYTPLIKKVQDEIKRPFPEIADTKAESEFVEHLKGAAGELNEQFDIIHRRIVACSQRIDLKKRASAVDPRLLVGQINTVISTILMSKLIQREDLTELAKKLTDLQRHLITKVEAEAIHIDKIKDKMAHIDELDNRVEQKEIEEEVKSIEEVGKVLQALQKFADKIDKDVKSAAQISQPEKPDTESAISAVVEHPKPAAKKTHNRKRKIRKTTAYIEPATSTAVDAIKTVSGETTGSGEAITGASEENKSIEASNTSSEEKSSESSGNSSEKTNDFTHESSNPSSEEKSTEAAGNSSEKTTGFTQLERFVTDLLKNEPESSQVKKTGKLAILQPALPFKRKVLQSDYQDSVGRTLPCIVELLNNIIKVKKENDKKTYEDMEGSIKKSISSTTDRELAKYLEQQSKLLTIKKTKLVEHESRKLRKEILSEFYADWISYTNQKEELDLIKKDIIWAIYSTASYVASTTEAKSTFFGPFSPFDEKGNPKEIEACYKELMADSLKDLEVKVNTIVQPCLIDLRYAHHQTLFMKNFNQLKEANEQDKKESAYGLLEASLFFSPKAYALENSLQQLGNQIKVKAANTCSARSKLILDAQQNHVRDTELKIESYKKLLVHKRNAQEINQQLTQIKNQLSTKAEEAKISATAIKSGIHSDLFYAPAEMKQVTQLEQSFLKMVESADDIQNRISHFRIEEFSKIGKTILSETNLNAIQYDTNDIEKLEKTLAALPQKQAIEQTIGALNALYANISLKEKIQTKLATIAAAIKKSLGYEHFSTDPLSFENEKLSKLGEEYKTCLDVILTEGQFDEYKENGQYNFVRIDEALTENFRKLEELHKEINLGIKVEKAENDKKFMAFKLQTKEIKNQIQEVDVNILEVAKKIKDGITAMREGVFSRTFLFEAEEKEMLLLVNKIDECKGSINSIQASLRMIEDLGAKPRTELHNIETAIKNMQAAQTLISDHLLELNAIYHRIDLMEKFQTTLTERFTEIDEAIRKKYDFKIAFPHFKKFKNKNVELEVLGKEYQELIASLAQLTKGEFDKNLVGGKLYFAELGKELTNTCNKMDNLYTQIKVLIAKEQKKEQQELDEQLRKEREHQAALELERTEKEIQRQQELRLAEEKQKREFENRQEQAEKQAIISSKREALKLKQAALEQKQKNLAVLKLQAQLLGKIPGSMGSKQLLQNSPVGSPSNQDSLVPLFPEVAQSSLSPNPNNNGINPETAQEKLKLENELSKTESLSQQQQQSMSGSSKNLPGGASSPPPLPPLPLNKHSRKSPANLEANVEQEGFFARHWARIAATVGVYSLAGGTIGAVVGGILGIPGAIPSVGLSIGLLAGAGGAVGWGLGVVVGFTKEVIHCVYDDYKAEKEKAAQEAEASKTEVASRLMESHQVTQKQKQAVIFVNRSGHLVAKLPEGTPKNTPHSTPITGGNSGSDPISIPVVPNGCALRIFDYSDNKEKTLKDQGAPQHIKDQGALTYQGNSLHN